MSYRKEKMMSLTGVEVNAMSRDGLKEQSKNLLSSYQSLGQKTGSFGVLVRGL